jgi:hypothetical protein
MSAVGLGRVCFHAARLSPFGRPHDFTCRHSRPHTVSNRQKIEKEISLDGTPSVVFALAVYALVLVVKTNWRMRT